MRKNLTLKHIAQELNVSISTVSKALNNSSEISKATRQKIQAFAKLYNYKPNSIALSLKNRKSKTIAVIIPEIIHDFFANVINGIEYLANDLGYNVLICLSNESYEREVINMEMLAAGSIDGFVISLSKETQAKKDYHHIKEIINQGMPVVMFDRVTREVYTDKVMIDEFFENNEFDAIMAVNELYAVNVLRNALKRGIKVPEDLFLIAFTDGVISKNSIPSISTVKQNAFKMGEIAARLLIKKLESENEHEHYITEVIGTELLHRETTIP